MLQTTAALICLVTACFLPYLLMRGMQVNLNDEYLQKRVRRLGGGIYLWLILTAGLAASGILFDFSTFPPRPMGVVMLGLFSTLLIALAPGTGPLLDQTSPKWLIGMQVFRLPVEIFLWLLFLAEVVPIQMTFEGRNWDILTALTAPLIVYGCFSKDWPQALVVLWNLLGLGLLLNIVVVSMLSMPTPARYFMNEPANTFIATFPFILLPTILVPFALGLHVMSLRQWLRQRRTQA